MKKWFLKINLFLLLAIFTVAFIYSQWPFVPSDILSEESLIHVILVFIACSFVIFLLIRLSKIKNLTDYLAVLLILGFAVLMTFVSIWAIKSKVTMLSIAFSLINLVPYFSGVGGHSTDWSIIYINIFLQWFIIGLIFLNLFRKIISMLISTYIE
jgi:hypothetical protein